MGIVVVEFTTAEAELVALRMELEAAVLGRHVKSLLREGLDDSAADVAAWQAEHERVARLVRASIDDENMLRAAFGDR